MLGILIFQIPIYREETKPRICPAHCQTHCGPGLPTSIVRLMAVVGLEEKGLHKPVGPCCTPNSNVGRLMAICRAAKRAEAG